MLLHMNYHMKCKRCIFCKCIFFSLMMLLLVAKHVKVFCENSVVALSCPRCKKLHILNASYGRTNTSSCRRGSTRRTNCAACGSKCKVKKYCHGKRSCRFSASNHVFGDPCRGTYKYLRVTFKCVASRESSFNSFYKWDIIAIGLLVLKTASHAGF